MTTSVPPPSVAKWHYQVGGQQIGPVTMTQLTALIQSRSVTAATMVWREGMAGWAPAGAIPELAYALQSARPRENYLGLNTAGLVVFIVLLVSCLPLCWLPWVIDSLKARE